MALQNSINAPTPLSAAKGGTGINSTLINGGVWVGRGTSISASAISIVANGMSTTRGPGTIDLSNNLPFDLETILPDPTLSFSFINFTAAGSAVICTNTSTDITTFTLPTSPILGQFIQVIGGGTFGWRINAFSQRINIGGIITTATTGWINSTNSYDSIILYYVVTGFWVGIPISGDININ